MKQLLLFCLLSLPACSFPTPPNTPYLQEEITRQLVNIRIERWGDLKFSGLLALQKNNDSLSYVLLDPTGVKLLEAELPWAGTQNKKSAGGKLAGSSLENFLSIRISRIYMQAPYPTPCSRNFLLCFCQETGQKYLQVGPVTVWKAETTKSAGNNKKQVIYTEPWIGVRMTLTLLPPTSRTTR